MNLYFISVEVELIGYSLFSINMVPAMWDYIWYCGHMLLWTQNRLFVAPPPDAQDRWQVIQNSQVGKVSFAGPFECHKNSRRSSDKITLVEVFWATCTDSLCSFTSRSTSVPAMWCGHITGVKKVRHNHSCWDLYRWTFMKWTTVWQNMTTGVNGENYLKVWPSWAWLNIQKYNPALVKSHINTISMTKISRPSIGLLTYITRTFSISSGILECNITSRQ